jgi:threonine aldolase
MDRAPRSLLQRFLRYRGARLRARYRNGGELLSLATLSPPYGAIFAHEEAHIQTDECGAPAFFSGGAQLALLPGEHARISPQTFARALADHPSVNVGLHSVQPAALSLTQMTEFGTAYRAGSCLKKLVR